MSETLSPQDIQHIKNCQYGEWLKLFRKHTPKSRVLAAPEEFRQYLLADGIHLPGSNDDDSDEGEWETPDPRKITSIDEELKSTSHDDNSDDEDDEQSAPVHIPQAFQDEIGRTIKELNGAVAPKLNWSAPKDALWISPTNNMKSINAHDIYQLIKASDYCTFDITQALGPHKGPEELTLVLREWFDINPALEFRCFVKEGKLIGVTQRDLNYYEFLYDIRKKLGGLLTEFVSELVETFPDHSFVADVYIPRPFDRVWLIDINPFLERTDSLLFSWDQLREWPDDRAMQFRLVDKLDSTRGFSSVQHSTNHVPHDLVDMDKDSVRDLVEKLKESYDQQKRNDKDVPLTNADIDAAHATKTADANSSEAF